MAFQRTFQRALPDLGCTAYLIVKSFKCTFIQISSIKTQQSSTQQTDGGRASNPNRKRDRSNVSEVVVGIDDFATQI
jgi:hypothetical protein